MRYRIGGYAGNPCANVCCRFAPARGQTVRDRLGAGGNQHWPQGRKPFAGHAKCATRAVDQHVCTAHQPMRHFIADTVAQSVRLPGEREQPALLA